MKYQVPKYIKPVWEHDCDQCRYLATIWLDGPEDWYVCRDTILARFSDDGPDYWSMLQGQVQSDHALVTKVTAVHDRCEYALEGRFITARWILENLK